MSALEPLRGIVAVIVRWTGVAALVRHTIARRKVSILVYHDPEPEVLERHLEYLAPRFSFITLSQLAAAVRHGSWSTLPPRSLVITFDDGRRGNARLHELFVRYGVVPTIFLCSQIAATNRHFWFLEAEDSEELKRLPNAERLELLAQRGFSVTKEYEERHALDRDEIALLNGSVEFGGHTRFHPVLTTCSDEECESEIAEAKTELQALVGEECRHFAYPNGDYDEREIGFLKAAGYQTGRTIDVGWNDRNADPYRLRILGTTDGASVTRLAADLSGVPLWLSRLREGSLRGKHRQVSRTASS